MRTDWPAPSPARRRTTTALLLCVLLQGCGQDVQVTGTPSASPIVVTDFNSTTELFVEFAPLVANERSTFAAHLTRLDDYSPVTAGTLDIVLSGGDAPTERFRVNGPRTPGIFTPTVVPRATGDRQLQLRLTAPGLTAVHDLGTIAVYPSTAAATNAPRTPAVEGEIGFLKEQQWRSDFAIGEVTRTSLRESVRAPAIIKASHEGEFVVTAPAPGLIRATQGFPALGDLVEQGQILATLIPHLGIGTDSASLQVELVAARTTFELARTEVARMERLFAQEAVAARRLEEARASEEVAAAQRQAAEQRMAQVAGEGRGGIALRAPISGTLGRVHVGQGTSVQQGAPLFHIVDRSEIWLEAQVSESDAAQLQAPTGAAFELPGLPDPVEIDIDRGDRLVGVGQIIDSSSKSVPVIFAMKDPDRRIMLNQLVQSRVFTGARREALTVPVTAVIDDGGQRVVYLMRGGESFSRVAVRTGVRDGERIEIRQGLTAGDRVVTRGAVEVRLAAATPEAMGHGHAH